MTKRWIKNGVFASDAIELNGCVVCNPTEDMLRQAGYKEYQEPVPTDEEKLEEVKAEKIAEITAYDTSSSVNGFVLNGLLVWLDKATRVGLMNSTTIAKAAGQETTTLWLGGIKLVVDCDKAIQLLSVLEMYALECFNVTASHKATVNELTTIEEVEAYDYKTGYPKMLEMSV
jgi:hypothetical protein